MTQIDFGGGPQEHFGLFSRRRSGRSVELTTQHHLGPSLRMSGFILSRPIRLHGVVLKYEQGYITYKLQFNL
jgi:hypothetical protein